MSITHPAVTDPRIGEPHSAAMPSAVKTLGQLVGQFAHDLNNHLAVALTGVELAARVEDREKSRQLLAGALEAIERQRVLIDAMARASLACSHSQPVDVHELLAACRASLADVLAPARLEFRLEAQHAVVLCDASFLRTALVHIALNARRSMHHDGVLAIVTFNGARPNAPSTAPANFLLSATHVGAKLDDEQRRQAFEAFPGGTANPNGLGLAQVRDTARRAGGMASVENIPTGSTSIQLTFPLA
jgi:signal transduction histidine kinase